MLQYEKSITYPIKTIEQPWKKTASLLVIVYVVEEFVPQTWPF